jgi:F0F1-type ATP synthase delta subunit
MLSVEQVKLPLTVVSQSDLRRIRRELNSLNDFFVSANNRQAGTAINPPALTRSLNELANENRCNLLKVEERNALMQNIDKLLAEAPLLHVSFAVEPSVKALEKVLAWLRQNVHQHALLQVGLQPAIAAGCVLRTPNKIFDMSLHNHLEKQRDFLTQLIRGGTHE